MLTTAKRVAAIAMLVVVLSGCATPAGKAAEDDYGCAVRVTVSSWSGWEADYEPEETVFEYKVDAPGPLTPAPGEKLGIDIKKIDINGITLETDAPMSPFGKTINLASDQTVFTVYQGQTLSLVTPTTDCGDIYHIEVVEMYGVR